MFHPDSKDFEDILKEFDDDYRKIKDLPEILKDGNNFDYYLQKIFTNEYLMRRLIDHFVNYFPSNTLEILKGDSGHFSDLNFLPLYDNVLKKFQRMNHYGASDLIMKVDINDGSYGDYLIQKLSEEFGETIEW